MTAEISPNGGGKDIFQTDTSLDNLPDLRQGSWDNSREQSVQRWNWVT